MNIAGNQEIGAPQNEVWTMLNDVGVLQKCIPGCTELVSKSENELTAKIVLKIGPIKANFSSDILLSDIDPPNGYLLGGKGDAGSAGYAEGSIRVRLEQKGEEATMLLYDGKVDIGGKIAQLGGRLIEATSRKYIAHFFSEFSEITAPTADEKVGWFARFIAWLRRSLGFARGD